ncbi:26S proteasome regulatory subunit N2 [Schistosoma bovis]|uniref:26S proteasome non-ATPase regulatory subunit 1 n=1 Tax=Schistosoma bovis TaxID=6184 RepID=A0A430QLH9_SCHBO|nr:26S proteasome regulatory subunit N2 [Schistosoma bovis]
MALTSAAGLVSLLDDKGSDVKAFALKRLYDMVDEFWAEISEAVMKIEILHEDSNFEYNKLAALLVSKVYYHLAVYDDALHYALCAEELFDLNANTEFVETIIAKCIDKYTALRTAQDQLVDSSSSVVTEYSDDSTWSVTSPTYKRLEHVVNQMFDRCFDHKQYKQALGIAIETRRLDIFEKAIISSDDQEGMLRYAFRVVLTLIDSVRLRNRLLKILVSVYMNRALPSDAVNVCQCLVLMDDPQINTLSGIYLLSFQATADTLEHLLLQSQEAAVTAYQIGFDLYENATQNFLQRVSASLARSSKLSHVMSLIERDKNAAKSSKTPEGSACTTVETTDGDKNKSDNKEAEEAVETALASETNKEAEIPADEPLSELDKEIKNRLMHLVSILSGDKVIELHLQFLIRNNKADLRLLERIRDEVRHSVTHNATVIANGIMHCGTTSDQFLRDHLNWLGKAVNWAKFTATATLGVIHKGHEKEALRLMSAYLPKDASGSSGSVYTEGGGLFALGLIHANHGGTMTEYLLNQCKEATAEPVRHGACLGLGLAAMGTGREDVYDQIKLNLYQDDAITGEAAGIGIGLVMLGTGSTRAIEDLLGYAKETAHEKIIRGVALGIALVMYGRVEEADELIDNLIIDNDPILRWSGMATIAMAYCGTGNNQAVKRLLHAAVSDTNDDVRRWAVTALGFVLFKNPEQVPSLVSLLVESYHPHLRYGAAMAVGIACAGTALKEAVSLLETLHEGTVPFVRQGALIANAMVLIQQNAVTSPKSVDFRQKLLKIIGDRHEDLLAKFGAIIACGILDAGGCNMTISLQTRTGNANMAAAVGLLIFQNFWFWHPLTNFISLAFTPTALIALNKDLNMPKIQFRSNAKPSTFAYPQPLQQEKEKKREKVETAILSITAKQRKKEADRKQHKEQQQSTTTGGAQTRKDSQTKEVKMDIDTPLETVKEEKPSASSTETKEEKEPNFSLLNNPARVMRSQQRYVTLPESSRYVTLKPISQGGILMVQDKSPQDAEVLVENVLGHGPTLERSGVGGGTGSSSGTSSSDLAAALGSGSNSKTELIHASTIGAYLDEDDDDDDEEDEDDDEDSSSDMHEEDEDDDEEEFDVAAATVSTVEIEESDDHTSKGDIEMSESSTEVRRDKSRGTTSSRRGSKSHVSSSEPNPPEPFLYIEEGTTSQTTTSSIAGSSSTSSKSDSTVATDTSSTNAKQSPPTSSSEPMDVIMETDKEAEKKSDSELDSKSKDNNDK